jgi:hypothetical protein
VFYIQDENGPPQIECGENLGDMTNELKLREYIDEFVCGGPNNYLV